MKRIAVFGSTLLLASAMFANAALGAPGPKIYANCQALNVAFPYGVAATPAAAQAMAGTLHFRPTTNKSIYNANIKLDSPRNGTVCEVDLPKGPPSAVNGLRVLNSTTDRADLTWDAPSATGNSPITGYSASGTSGAVFVVGTSATVTGLAPGSTYTFLVSAINAIGVGPASSVIVTTKAAAAAPAPPVPAGPATVTHYQNCTDAKNAGVTPIRRDTNPALYAANSGLDRDKDGVACE